MMEEFSDLAKINKCQEENCKWYFFKKNSTRNIDLSKVSEAKNCNFLNLHNM